jgi:hypothetical protein
MVLRETLAEIKKKKELEYDKDLANLVGIDAAALSRLQRSIERGWIDHSEVFLHIAALCKEPGIDFLAVEPQASKL